MAKLLVHIVTGPENPTRAALGLLVARTAMEAGHSVDVFIAGDGVVDRPTGDARRRSRDRDREPARARRRARSRRRRPSTSRGCRARRRGIDAAALGGLAASLVPPTRLVELILEADRVVTY